MRTTVLERQKIVCRRWWVSLSLLVTVSHPHLTSLDTTELGPGTILGPSSPFNSASTERTNVYHLYPRFKFFIVLHQQRFPRLGLFLEFSHALYL
jgi:hypothetical protein